MDYYVMCVARLVIQLAVASQHYAVRERELQQTLRIREQSHNKSVEELRDMLTSQFQVATRSPYLNNWRCCFGVHE